MPAEAGFADVLRDLVARLGGDPGRVRVESVDDLQPGEVGAGEFVALDGVLTLRGTEIGSASAALARYLARHARRRISWDSPRLEPPLAAWPDAPETRVATPFGIRYHFNAVTYGYSAPYWDWSRWERELDWMVLHGVTHPLVLTGFEAVLAESLRRAGMDRVDVAEWIGSAAHLPWMSMGNLHSFGGPLPASWEARRLALARRILERARELGMTPVLPMTGGHVPPVLAGEGASEVEWQGWSTPVLAPESDAFQQFATHFLRVQRELLGDLGPTPVIAVDPYTESLPPSGEPDALAAAGAGIHRAITSVHPGATWLLQGWPFHYQRAFWTSERVGAFLGDVPQESLLLIDLWGEHAPMWREGMHGRRWIWTALHNFGGRFALFGDLRGIARDVRELSEAPPPRLEGVGLAPEAIENNSVYYELATDLTWGLPGSVEEWLEAFPGQRYGVDTEAGSSAWRLLGDTLYAPGRTRSIPSPVIARPWAAQLPFAAQRLAGEALAEPQRQSANIDAENDPSVLGDLPAIARAARLLISLGDAVPVLAPLERDVIEITGHVIGQGTRLHIRGILAAYRAGDPAAVRSHAQRLRSDLLELDELAGTHPASRGSAWLAAARAWGDSRAERDVMERDARSLISVWGEQSSGLHDYSGRHWSGMVSGLYLPRWETWAQWLAAAAERGAEPDPDELRARIIAIEEGWRAEVGADLGADETGGLPLAVAGRILDRLGY